MLRTFFCAQKLLSAHCSIFLSSTIFHTMMPLGQRSLLISLAVTFLFFLSHHQQTKRKDHVDLARDMVGVIKQTAEDFINDKPHNSEFGKMGRHVQHITKWEHIRDKHASSLDVKSLAILSALVEDVTSSHFPFIQSPSAQNNTMPLATLQKRSIPGSKGIVISTGKKTARYAGHLIRNIRTVLHSRLPIQIAYAGELDLPFQYRKALISQGADIEMLDLLTVLDDSTLQLADSGFAVKPFAILASTFEQVILLDADAVFLQQPELIFEDNDYVSTGTLLFHDRLMYQGGYKARHEWWQREMRFQPPSSTLLRSRVHNEGFAEEGDSGVVALDKRRSAVFMALLHICWQNTFSVRNDYTYRFTYGDKESYWFGLELSHVTYSFEPYYAVPVGWLSNSHGSDVCSYTVGHVRKGRTGDHHHNNCQKLFWFNGSLLRNKAKNQTDYVLPTHWMLGGTWRAQDQDYGLSCKFGDAPQALDEHEKGVLQTSIEEAQEFDTEYQEMLGF